MKCSLKTTKSGYILIMALLMLSMATVIVTYIFSRGASFTPHMQTTIRRQKAKELALGGLQLGIAQINEAKKVEQSQQTQENPTQQQIQAQEAKDLLKRLLPTLNRWQSFTLKEATDGIDAELKIVISCEQGKIDVNQIYDFEKKKFVGQGQLEGDWKKLLQTIFKKIETSLQAKALFESFEKFLKARQYKLNDASELLTIPEFATFKDHIFYQPPIGKADKEKTASQIYLEDVFTVFSGTSKMQPWLFSNSIAQLLDLKVAQAGDIAERKKQVGEWLNNFKETSDWKQDWNTILAEMYGKELNSLPKDIQSFLETKFEPTNFSVLSFATVDGVTQRVKAIVERKKDSQNGKTKYDVLIKRVYWL